MKSTFGNRTYTATALSKIEILQNHISVLNTFKIPANETNKNYSNSTGYQNFTKILTNKDTLLDLVNVPESPYRHSSPKERAASDVL